MNLRRRILLVFFVLTAVLLSAEQRCGYHVERVCVPLQCGDNASAYLLTPDSIPAGGCPAVLVLHDHGAHFSIGKEKMVCPPVDESAPQQERARQSVVHEDAEAWVKKFYDGAFVGDSLARAGYVVLSMDALYWGERAVWPAPWQQGTAAVRSYNHQMRDNQPAFYWQYLASHSDTVTTPCPIWGKGQGLGASWPECILSDDKDAVTYLVSLSCVNPRRIACFGFSMGAYRAWNLAAADPRVAVCVAAHWMTTIRRNGGTLPNASSYSMYMPSVYPLSDYPEVAARIAPRPFLLIYGTQDPLFIVPAVLEADAVIRQAYRAAGATDRYTIAPFPSAHRFTAPERISLIDFLKKNL